MDLLSGMLPIFIALLVFSILVVVHEFGHFIVAKKSGILVEEFSVGMGPILISKKFGETLYSIRAFPLGGFCRMLEEDQEGDDERSFGSKGVLARMCVIVAGPIMNFILAFLLIFIIVGNTGFVRPIISETIEGFPAQEAGAMAGDKILSLDGQKLMIYQDVELIMEGNHGEPMNMIVERNGQKLSFEVMPKKDTATGRYLIGFRPLMKSGIFDKEQYDGVEKSGIIETGKVSFATMGYFVKSVVVGFVRLFTFNISADEVTGPIGIVEVIGDSYEAGIKQSKTAAILNVMNLSALLSANLGVINLFPIPAMDGGRLIFLILESIRKKPVDQNVEGAIHFAGFVMLMIFMAFIAFKDIARFF